MNNSGKIISLFVSEEGSLLKKREEISIDANGVLGDKHYGADRQRSVLISSTDSYALMHEHQIITDFGILGENILMDYNPYKLFAGERLKIGETILEISQNCTLCNHLSKIDKRLPKLIKNDRGIFAKVIKAGKISVGDSVSLVGSKQ